MTLYEAIIEYQYDVTINCTINDDDDKSIEYNTTVPVWYWDINGGYSSVGSKYYKSASEAQDSLITFLKTFKPFEK